MQSVSWTRAYLRDMLDHAHARRRPMEGSTRADDISFLAGPQGYRAQVDRPGGQGFGLPDESQRYSSLRTAPAPRQKHPPGQGGP
eukprot:4670619-Pyramimonas_sp.AAC.1